MLKGLWNISPRRHFRVIAAVTKDWGLGFKGQLPWKGFENDMRWFRQETMGGTVIMGHGTWRSLGKCPLPGRHNIIVSRHLWPETVAAYNPKTEEVSVCQDLESALYVARQRRGGAPYYTEQENDGGVRGITVIGGSGLYTRAIEHQQCQRILLTYVNARLPVDCFFPALSPEHWVLKTSHGQERSRLLARKASDSDFQDYEVDHQFLEYHPARGHHRDPSTCGPPPESAVGARTALSASFYRGEAGYLQALQDILKHGERRDDRTGVGTNSLFGLTFCYDLTLGFPLFTTKRMAWNSIVTELLWFLRGSTDVRWLQERGVHIWDGNISRKYLESRGLGHYPPGEAGPIYGHQLRRFGAPYPVLGSGAHIDPVIRQVIDEETTEAKEVHRQTLGIDQIAYVVRELQERPNSRKAVISLWNPMDLAAMALEPCHILYHFWISRRFRRPQLCCSLTQRSGDMGLGVPFNVASAALLTHILAKEIDPSGNLQVGELVHHIGDAHIYHNHEEGIRRQVQRLPRPCPQISLEALDNRSKLQESKDVRLSGYCPHDGITLPMAI